MLIVLVLTAGRLAAQDTLPRITVKNLNGQIVLSWKNNYKKIITAINIQRSFDSLKNYSTIGSVLNPMAAENGYADVNPPYNKMYYRIFVSFEGGAYVFTNIYRPVKIKLNYDTGFAWQPDNRQQPVIQLPPDVKPVGNEITYPSRRVFTNKESNVIIYLADAPEKKYSIKFYNEKDNMLFELKKIEEPYLIIEKVNFSHAGWFNFEIFENGKMIEKNKFVIQK